MPIKRRTLKTRITGLTETQVEYFLDGAGPPRYSWERFSLECNHEATMQLWHAHEEELLKDFIAQHPCRRPSCWWKFSAPEPRQRTGGAGEPMFENDHLLGIPREWEAIDSENPPAFESEAAYLKRHGLLTFHESRHLAKHPDLLQDEILPWEDPE